MTELYIWVARDIQNDCTARTLDSSRTIRAISRIAQIKL